VPANRWAFTFLATLRLLSSSVCTCASADRNVARMSLTVRAGAGPAPGPDRPLNRILLVEGSMHSYLQQRGGSEAVDRERTLGDDSFSPSGELPSTRIG
jgi:hypothetical protein